MGRVINSYSPWIGSGPIKKKKKKEKKNKIKPDGFIKKINIFYHLIS
jgi:hypothetical protein